MKVKKYFSIGEVCKIIGITPRMVRHYDKLGILPPAYINPENGYRYYTKNQMVILNLIIICVDIGIPLKQINSYIENGDYNINRILADGEAISKARLTKINNNLFLLNKFKNHLRDINREYEQPYTRNFDRRYFITEPIDRFEYQIEDYWKTLPTIYNKIEQYNLTSSINQGQCLIFSDNGYTAYAYVEINKTTKKLPELLVIPSGNYTCELYEDENFDRAYTRYFKQYKKGTIILIEDVFNETIGSKIPPFELQLISLL